MVFRQIVVVFLGIIAYYIGSGLLDDKRGSEILFEDLPEEIRKWHDMGNIATIHGRKMFYIFRKCSNLELKNPPTFGLIHGFPSSSYEYHKILKSLTKHGNVVLNDHIGFGFSDGPKEGYTYSLGEAAENILALWRHLGIKEAHIVSHDKGDSILTEILARRERKMLPNYFDGFFQSVTFTNGGMKYEMINFRITQTILMYPKLGKPMIYLSKILGLQKWITKKQIEGIWSPTANITIRDNDIEQLYLINAYSHVNSNTYKTIYYLWDRSNFEFRWFDALKKLDIPCRFIWGDSDAVSPIAIPESFEKMVPIFDLTLVKGGGHFWMLEKPNTWVKEIVKILQDSTFTQ